MSELTKRGIFFDGPATTMLRSRDAVARPLRGPRSDEFRRLARARREEIAIAFEEGLEEDFWRIGDRIVRDLTGEHDPNNGTIVMMA